MAKVTHEQLLDKIMEHDEILVQLADTVNKIESKLDPIVKALGSIAFAFKGLLIIGAGSAAVAGILELADRLTN